MNSLLAVSNTDLPHHGHRRHPAAVAVGKLLDFNQEQLINLLGSAGTQAAGLWEFLRDAADLANCNTAKAAADGLLAAYLTADKPDRCAQYSGR